MCMTYVVSGRDIKSRGLSPTMDHFSGLVSVCGAGTVSFYLSSYFYAGDVWKSVLKLADEEYLDSALLDCEW
jgi:hypothetical protein